VFRIADALELHRPDRGKKEYTGVNKTIQRTERVSDSVGLEKEGEGRVET